MARRADDGWLFRLAADATQRTAGVRVTEINNHVAVADVPRNIIAEIQAGRALRPGCRRRRGNRLAHPAFRAEQEDAHRSVHSAPANASSVLRNRAWFAALISHN